MTTEMMTYDEVAQCLGLAKGTVYAMVHRKKLPHVRLGPRLVRFPKADLDAWVRERTVVPEPTR